MRPSCHRRQLPDSVAPTSSQTSNAAGEQRASTSRIYNDTVSRGMSRPRDESKNNGRSGAHVMLALVGRRKVTRVKRKFAECINYRRVDWKGMFSKFSKSSGLGGCLGNFWRCYPVLWFGLTKSPNLELPVKLFVLWCLITLLSCHTCFSKENQVHNYMHARIKFMHIVT
jgi:hypothetical protein